jgi:CDP-glucose 4,6-dehydratase
MEKRTSSLEGLEIVTPSFWKNKKVLITGHTGFKGAWLSYLLSSWGAKVSGLSLAPERPSFYELLQLDQQVVSHIGDIRNPELVQNVFLKEKPEIVFHMAAQALVRPSYQDPVGTYATNVMGTAHVLEGIRKISSVKSCVVVTSDKCYENREWARGYKEDDAMGGWDPYSSSKGCAEILTSSWVRSFFHDRPIGIASGRAGNVIGGGDFAVDRLIPDCMRAFAQGEKVILRNPSATRPWQHVLEPLSGYITLAETNFQEPFHYRGGWNFGPGPDQELTVEQVVKAARENWGDAASFEVQSAGHPHEAHLLKLDCSKAFEKLAWKPTLNFEQTIQWTIEWYKAWAHHSENLEKITARQVQSYTELAGRMNSKRS